MELLTTILILIFILIGLGCKSENRAVDAPVPEINKAVKIKPLFDAALLAGKNPKEVAKILGNPSDSWAPRDNPNGQMQSFDLEKTQPSNSVKTALKV